jgi:outer membrane protein insertion porin family
MARPERRLRAGGCVLAACLAAGICGIPRPAAGDELDYGLEQHRLARIELSGNITFSADELKDVLQIREATWMRPFASARYRPALLDAQLRLLQRYYQRRGFHQVSVGLDSIGSAGQTRGDVVHISIDEGPRTILASVGFDDTGPFREGDLREDLQFRPGVPAPADLNDLGQDIYILRARFWQRAYLEAQITPEMAVRPDPADPDRFAADLVYHVDPGQPYVIRRIEVEGNRQTRRDLIERELRLGAGDPFAWGEIDRARRRLLETALFRDIHFLPTHLDSAAGEADLTVRVVERKPAFYELGAGVGSRERVRLLGAWGHNNLWGSGRRLTLRGKVYWNVEEIVGSDRSRSDPEINYRTDVYYINPHLRGSRFRLDTNVYLERETRGETGINLNTIGASLGTQFRGGQRILNTVALQFEQYDPDPHPDAPQFTRDFVDSAITSTQTRSLVYTLYEEGRDDVFRPRRGRMVNLQVEFAGGPLEGDNTFIRGVTGWHFYRPFPLGGTLAFRVSFGAVRPFGDSRERGADGVPYKSRFFAGGVSSVRGYQESSLGPRITDQAQLDSLQITSDVPLPDNPARGGNYLLLTNVEWRFPLPLLSKLNLGGVLFLDGGNVWERASDIRLRAFRLRSYPRLPDDPSATKVADYRYGVGTGLRLETPFGPFRFDVGWPLKRAAFLDDEGQITGAEDKVMYHFSLGYPF